MATEGLVISENSARMSVIGIVLSKLDIPKRGALSNFTLTVNPVSASSSVFARKLGLRLCWNNASAPKIAYGTWAIRQMHLIGRRSPKSNDIARSPKVLI